jgi:signal transduction histidine kinase
MVETERLQPVRQVWRGLVELLIGSEPPRRHRLLPQILLLLVTVLMALAMLQEVRLDYELPLPKGPVAPLLALLLVLPIALLARWPLMAWRVCLVMLLVLAPFWHFGNPSDLPAHPIQVVLYLITLVNLGLRRSRLMLGWAWVATMVVVWAVVYPPNANNAIGATVIVTLLTLASGGIGAVVTARRQLAAEAQRTEEAQSRRALLEERARIARELHDVVAHHMSLIAVQAETAPYRLAELPAAARDEFGSISGAAREALAEMRRLLGVLRSERPDTPELAPQPGLDALDDLLDRVRQAGTELEYRTTGAPRRVPAGVDLSAYRVIQESLSNARRHAPGAPVLVHVAYDPDAVRVVVRNAQPATPARPSGGPGQGLVGMRERVTMLGGTLAANPTPDGGFAVVAVLPSRSAIEGKS